MENNGTAGATSTWGSTRPKYAFQSRAEQSRAEQSSYFWNSEDGFPQSIWMKFATPRQIAKLGYYSLSYAPRRFNIIGSSDCAEPWTILLHVADSNSKHKERTWTVPQQNRRAFKCIGLKIETTYADDLETTSVALQNIQMWGRDADGEILLDVEEEVERNRKESKPLEEEVERCSAAQNSLKEEIYRLKNESTAIKACKIVLWHF